MKPTLSLALMFTSAFGFLVAACDGKNSSKDEEPTTEEGNIEALSETETEAETKTDHRNIISGHNVGDAGHAPQGSVLSSRGVFLASVSWSENLVAGSLANQATISFWEPKLHKTPATLKSFKLFMPSMGHGSIKTDQLVLSQNPGEPAVWKASQIYFSMPGASGEWVVDIEAEVAGQTDKVRIEIPFEVKE